MSAPEKIAEVQARKAAEAERDRQYDENVSLIAENASIVAERDRLAADLERKVALAKEALLEIEARPESMIWGEDTECVEAMREMEAIARTALASLEDRA